MNHFHFETDIINRLAGVERKKYGQEIKVIKALYVDGPQTTSQLCKRLKISAPNMMSIINEMTEKKVIEKKGLGKSIGGRKPDLIRVVADNFCVMAIDLSIYKMRVAIFNAENKPITEAEEYSFVLNNEKETLDFITEKINSYIIKFGINKNKLLGVGISMPGLVNSVIGINYTYLNFGAKPVVEAIEAKIGRPVFIENDAKAMALAEFRLGRAKKKKDVLVLFLDWGIGLGMILDGKLYRGTSGFAGEFSHIPIVENGKLCRCGKLGCIETIASGINVLALAEEGVKEGKTSINLESLNTQFKYLGLKNVIKAAKNGDQYAIDILEKTGKNLGKGTSILIQLFNPELIVLCGKLAESGELITAPMQQGINMHAMKQISDKTKIVVSEFGDEIGMYAALAIVMDNAFDMYLAMYGK